MNLNWQAFLKGKNILSNSSNNPLVTLRTMAQPSVIFPTLHLAVLSVSGNEAKQFLQGQITCNIDDINQQQASIGAFCNAKGRVISTFFILQKDQGFLLILPKALIVALQKRLQMYIMRAKVHLQDQSEQWCLLGLKTDAELALPTQALQCQNHQGGLVFKYPVANYWLWLGANAQAIDFWNHLTEQNQMQGQTAQAGLVHNIYAGIPWLTSETSEQYIPQSLNLGQLKGISFKKGCYTGQEIIARTHYLGKSKNTMVRAQMSSSTAISLGSKLYNLDSNSQQSIGNIINAEPVDDHYQMLVIIKQELAQASRLSLQDAPSPIELIN